MDDLPELLLTAQKILGEYGRAKRGERVLVVTDSGYSPAVLAALQGAAISQGLSLSLLTLLPTAMKTPPDTYVRALEAVDLAVLCTSKRFYGSYADCLARGGRVLNLTRTTPRQLSQSLNIDRDALQAEIEWFAGKLAKSASLVLTTALGGDLRLKVGGRDVLVVDGEAGPGESDTYPGVVSITPVESATEGRFVADSTIGWIPHGEDELFNLSLCEAMTIEVSGGKVTGVSGGREAPRIGRLLRCGEGADVVAEIGLGLNSALREPTGNLLLDESVYGAVHIGVGNNLHLGGQNRARQHVDFIIRNATIHCDGEPVVVDGVLRR